MHTVSGAVVSNSRHYMCVHMYVYVSMYINIAYYTYYVLYCVCVWNCKCSHSLHTGVFMGIQKDISTPNIL